MSSFSRKEYLSLKMPTEEVSVSDQKRIELALHTLGYDHVTITGDASNIVNKGGNLQCTEAASYKITVTYDGPSDSWTIDLKK